MGCGCVRFSNNKDNIKSAINKSQFNNITTTEKEAKNIVNKNNSADNIEKINILNNETTKAKNSSSKISEVKQNLLKSRYSIRERNYNATNEDFSEYYLLLGKDIEPLTIKTELFISCKNLPNLSKIFGYYTLAEKKDGNFWSVFGQTEISRYTSNPSFIKSFIINYNFKKNDEKQLFKENEEKQLFRFTVKYIEKDENTTSLGTIEIDLHTLFSNKNQEITKSLKGNKGQVTIKGAQKKNISKFIQMRIGIKGPRMTNNKIFCRISRKTNSKNESLPLNVTEEKEHIHEKKEKVFYWKIIEFDSDRIEKKLLISTLDINIVKFQIFEVEKKKKEKLLTQKEVNIDDLINGSEFFLPKVTDDYNYLILDQIKTLHHYSFFSFLISGMQYTPCFFIDCTKSKFNLILSEQLGNKYSKNFISKFQKEIDNNEELIYRPWYDINFKKNERNENFDKVKEQILININGSKMYDKTNTLNNISYKNMSKLIEEENNEEENKPKNPFEHKSELCKDYKKYSDKLFESLIRDQFLLSTNNRSPVFLFGCRVPKENKIECYNFSNNCDILNPEIEGYKKMHETYINLFSNLYLSFPCVIQDSLNHFYKYISNDKFTTEKQMYHVAFFILTNYMNDTNYLFDFILKYSNLPFSIIIVSLGDEFKADEFESKINEYISNHEKDKNFRNNIIYINFNTIDFRTNDYERNINTLCKQIYYKLSQQFVSFINMVKIPPLDSNNLSNKNTPDFLEFRKNNMYKSYIIPKFLMMEKEQIIKDILDLGFEKELFEYTFDNKLPTFDKHYIINMLNSNKNKYEKMKSKTSKEISLNRNKTLKIECKKYFRFEDQMLIDERDLYFGENDKEKEISMNQSNNEKNGNLINEELCNFCKTHNINIIFQYCKHKYSCIYCLSKIKNNKCPICKRKISYYIRIYNT